MTSLSLQHSEQTSCTGLNINYKNLTPEYVNNFVQELKSAYTNLVNSILQLDPSEYSWSTLCEPFLVLDDNFASSTSIVEMSSFHINPEVRQACSDAETEISKFFVELSMKKDLYKVYSEYYQGVFMLEHHEEETKKYMDDKMTDYKLNGMNLEDTEYSRVKEIKMSLTELCNKVNLNINNENTFFSFSSSELDGMQEEYLTARIQNDGSYKITLKYPDFIGIMEYCKVKETRKIISTAFGNRCANENMPLVLEIFKLRKEMANLLGYAQYSDMTLVKKMASNTETVMTFLNSLKEKSMEACTNDLQKLFQLANSMDDTVDKIELWDVPYYSRIYKDLYTNLADEELKKYFPLNTVTNGMFQIYQTLLGLQFNDVTLQHEEKLWHDEVKLFEVVDSSSSQLVGHFFLDLFPRDGKYGHAAVFPFVTKSSKNLPVCAMACNFNREGYLKFNEVETYFHEFGHVMHTMCSDTRISQFGGTNCEWDFVEAPSQMLEEWCYRPVSLKMMADGITDDVIEKINLKRNMLQGYFNARQLCLGLYDMILHSTYFDTIENSSDPILSFSTLYANIVKESTGLEPIPNTNMIASFGHLFGGYSAGYYGYMWSKVYAKDMFVTKFLGHELDPIVGAEYRKEILSYGGSRPSIESLRIFLGRYPSDEAFIRSFNQ